jgi:hypothetical protein
VTSLLLLARYGVDRLPRDPEGVGHFRDRHVYVAAAVDQFAHAQPPFLGLPASPLLGPRGVPKLAEYVAAFLFESPLRLFDQVTTSIVIVTMLVYSRGRAAVA